MSRRRRRPSRLRKAVVTVVAMVLCVGAATAGVAGGRVLADRQHRITVYVQTGATREVVQLIGPQTVTSVLLTAGVVPRDGRLLSITKHATLRADLNPATITVDGRDAGRSDPVLEGMTVAVSNGTDEVEGTKQVDSILPAPPLPDVLRHAHHRGRTGVAREIVGLHSGEVVRRVVLKKPVAPRQVTERVVALTFDDGPNSEWTPIILNVLAEKGVKATFCEVGSMVDNHPDASEQVVAAGNQLCNHTLGHVEHLDTAPHATVEAQIGGGAAAFARHDLPTPAYYRPPGGHLSPDVIKTARAHGEAVLYWKVDTEDWRSAATADSIMANLQAEVDPGAIILMHDAGGRSRVVSVVTLGLAIDWLRSQGYGFIFPVID